MVIHQVATENDGSSWNRVNPPLQFGLTLTEVINHGFEFFLFSGAASIVCFII